MSTAATHLPLADAIREAADFRALFEGCYEHWKLAGSVRRGKPDVGDLDHVVIPILHSEGGGDLLGQGSPPVNWMVRRAKELLASKVLTLHDYSAVRDGNTAATRFGEKLLGLDYRGRKHEVWMCTPGNWGPILTIRTGSADFSHRFVMRLRERGYCQHNGWLHSFHKFQPRCPIAVKLLDGWGVPLDCPDEETYFAAAGYAAVIPPEERS